MRLWFKSSTQASNDGLALSWLLTSSLVTLNSIPLVEGYRHPIYPRGWQRDFIRHMPVTNIAQKGPPSEEEGRVPLKITNKCDSTIWPGIVTQSGVGPGTGGFELETGNTTDLWVSPDWQGRVWGRTNCTVNDDSCSCETGDCFGLLDCKFSGATPATLAEFTLSGGARGKQTFYDISLVDGYNLPLGINYIPAKNTTFVPPNLTNAACIATAGWLHAQNDTGVYYSNSSYPIPLEAGETNESLLKWCPWSLLAFPPVKPGDGVFPYPDDHIQRPDFSPCMSACVATGRDKDCCVGRYHDPEVCRPSLYSRAAKAICPDAYSFAYDDQESTFIIPNGGGWEVVLCPTGRSTNILSQLSSELFELASNGGLSERTMTRLRNDTYIRSEKDAAAGLQPVSSVMTISMFITVIWLARQLA